MDNEYSITTTWPGNGLPITLARRTRRIYDRMAPVYPISTMLFHSRAHRCAIEASGIRDGMRILEVATGSGEMFRRLLRANPNGATIGVDLSPNMASRTQRHAWRKFPYTRAHCQAVDARQMPFRDGSFDAVVCCYLLELISTEDIERILSEFRRVLRGPGRLTLVLIGQNTAFFNRLYRIAGAVAPAFWGRQVEQGLPELIRAADFRIVRDQMVRQSGYPSRVLVAQR
ncbi:MAG: class I SAM-dependent methyltransferase [Acidobacteria bacterium]|nr:class I SAM-dependent methyltransferase [Acidobacteriota bacterium]